MRGDEFAALIFSTLILAIGVVVFYSLLLRYRKRELQHKERLAALEKGMPLPELSAEGRIWSPRVYLLRGMLWLFGGITIVIFLGAAIASQRQPRRMESRLWRAQELRKLGATEEQIKQSETELDDSGPPLAMALLGLIPMGVGAAYLLYYRVESKSALPAGTGSSS